MATTFAFEVKTSPNGQGKYPIFIRITRERKHKRIKTSIELSKLSHWNPKTKRIRTSEKNATIWNDVLDKEMEKAKQTYREDVSASISAIAEKVKNQEKSTSFLEYSRASIESLFEVGASNAKHYQTFLRKLEEYLKESRKTDLLFSDLSPALVADFEQYLLKDSNEVCPDKRLHPNYVRALMIKFRALVNKAIKDDRLSSDKYPFHKHKILGEKPTTKEALSQGEIQAISALEYPVGTWLWNAKNCFLFSYYCAGIRVGDLIQLRWKNITEEGTRLEYTMGKNGKHRNYPLMQQAQQILALYYADSVKSSDYIFPFLDNNADWAQSTDIATMPVEMKKKLFQKVSSKNALLNRNLKKIATDAGIEKNLSFHISRHSFASVAREKNVSPKVVQEALAHSSLSITEGYLHNFSISEVDSALQEVFAPKQEKSKEDALLEALKALDKDALASLMQKLNAE